MIALFIESGVSPHGDHAQIKGAKLYYSGAISCYKAIELFNKVAA